MQLSDRLKRLGTETAFAISEQAAKWASQGNKVYPFHLGDLNIPTPGNVVEAATKAIISAAKTGKIGDGKVFISAIEEAVRIRTDEKGNEAL